MKRLMTYGIATPGSTCRHRRASRFIRPNTAPPDRGHKMRDPTPTSRVGSPRQRDSFVGRRLSGCGLPGGPDLAATDEPVFAAHSEDAS